MSFPPRISAEQLTKIAARVKLVAFDFDGVFTDDSVWVFEDGRETVRCCRADGIGLEKLRAWGIEMAIISAERNPIVRKRAAKLRIPAIVGCADKLAALLTLTKQKNISMEDVAFVGNDLPDLAAMLAVGFPIAVSPIRDVQVANIAKYIPSHQGGQGAVREICDMITKTKRKSRESDSSTMNYLEEVLDADIRAIRNRAQGETLGL